VAAVFSPPWNKVTDSTTAVGTLDIQVCQHRGRQYPEQELTTGR
jgi:hypothetical protein